MKMKLSVCTSKTLVSRPRRTIRRVILTVRAPPAQERACYNGSHAQRMYKEKHKLFVGLKTANFMKELEQSSPSLSLWFVALLSKGSPELSAP
jgi:hypothetical protein